MTGTRTFFRPTTPQQRRLLFTTWQTTGNVTHACAVARVARRTFYHWKARFDALGFAGVAAVRSSVPHHPTYVPPALTQQVIALRHTHHQWGKRRIADEVAKTHHWERTISPTTVRRILVTAALWNPPPPRPHAAPIPVRTAEQAGMTVNIDLCFVPTTHACAEQLPAVSGSSGRLVVERPPGTPGPTWPGRVFATSPATYEAAMTTFAQAAQDRCTQRRYRLPAPPPAPFHPPPRRVALAALQVDRRLVRQQRTQDDQAWRILWVQRQAVNAARRCAKNTTARLDIPAERQWQALRKQRQTTLAARRTEDSAWRDDRAALAGTGPPTLPHERWRAILIITDNCTRQCTELPLFVSGGRVTAEEVSTAFQRLAPATLPFVISDQGTHFTAKVFQTAVQRARCLHMPVARHRPESNGIAERCVRTLKEWLAPRAWASDAELRTHLAAFRAQYNDRPHQGLGIPGLSPNEFAKRIWLL